MAVKELVLVVLCSGMYLGVASTSDKRLVLHSDQDIQAAFDDIRRENLALKAEIDQLKRRYTGGNYYLSEGGAASYICLPESPSWAYHVDGLQNRGGFVYGTEYETSTFDQQAYGKSMQEQDAPCVVCHSPRATTIMIPGSTACYSGWTMEYSGYLMTGAAGHKSATDYACVDKAPEAVFHGEANLNGKLLYFTEVKCGSLPCQEYPQGWELACAVCSK